MFIIPTQRTTTMNSSHVYPQTETPGATTTRLGFYEVHQHLENNTHFLDEMLQESNPAMQAKSSPGMQPNAKVLFQFFDGWHMVQS